MSMKEPDVERFWGSSWIAYRSASSADFEAAMATISFLVVLSGSRLHFGVGTSRRLGRWRQFDAVQDLGCIVRV